MSFFEAAGAVISWWAVSLVMALAVWPIVFLCLRRLPDRGLAFARIFGLLFAGYLFWLGCWFHLWPNVSGAAWLAVILVAGVGSMLAARRKERPWAWLREHWKEALFLEALFLVLFAVWAFVRANNPVAEAAGGEKRMELAFINATMRSDYFPPNDPWLSGYAISYYHFGYILTNMLAKMTGVTGAVAHNLASAMWFGMAGCGSYGLLRNILLLRAKTENDLPAVQPPVPVKPRAVRLPPYLLLPLLAPFALLWLGNLEGSLEILYARGIGWENGQGTFWKWLDIKDLNSPPSGEPSATPTRFIWWWRASRVLNDRDLSGNEVEVIDEFPAFSFVLGDLHPHVLALPFLLAALAVILEILLRGGGTSPETTGERWLFLFFTALSIGSLVFLNTWDILLLGVAAGAGWIGWRYSGRELAFGPWVEWRAFLARWGVTAGIAILLFVPFFIGFSSQAGGILPNVIFPSRSHQYFFMFGVLLLPLLFWMILELFAKDARKDWGKSLGLVGLGAGALLIGSLVFAFIISITQKIDLSGVFAGLPPMQAVGKILLQRAADPLPWLLPLVFIAIALTLILGWIRKRDSEGGDAPARQPALDSARMTTVFVLLLALWGSLLVLFPEFFYLKDLFGARMNTIFKFYFQAWVFWSLAASYGVVRLIETVRGEKDSYRRVYAVLVLPLVLAGFLFGSVYLPMAVATKTNNFNPYEGATLDSSDHLALERPEDYAAITWMQDNITDSGPIAEAVGGDYTDYGRVAAYTGIPDVLGWVFHENQWRGGYSEVGNRQSDLEILFKSPSWTTAEQILALYNIRYVYFGPLEAQTYGRQGLSKFLEHLPVIYQNEGVTIFERMVP